MTKFLQSLMILLLTFSTSFGSISSPVFALSEVSMVNQQLTIPETSVSNEILVETGNESVQQEEQMIDQAVPIVKDTVWKSDNFSKISTIENISTNVWYEYPFNSQVKVQFTKLESIDTVVLNIQEIILDETTKQDLSAVSNVGYKITTNMQNGTFRYNLELPNPISGNNVEVIYSNSEIDLINNSINKVENPSISTENSVKLFNMDHFTVFVVVNPNPAGNSNESNDNCATVSIGGSVTCYDNIQSAIAAAVDGDEIQVKNGTYTISSQVSVNKQLTIIGESEGGTIIDMSSFTGYGFYVNADNVSISNMTVIPTAPSGSSFTFKIGNGFPYISNIYLSNITVENANRTPFDFNGVNDVVLTNLTANNTTTGNGISLSGVDGATISDSTLMGNAWGALAIYTSTFASRGSDNIIVDLVSITTDGNVYAQNNSGAGLSNGSNLTVNGAEYLVKSLAPGVSDYTFYLNELTNAESLALALPSPDQSYIVEIATGIISYPSLDFGTFSGTTRYIRENNGSDVAAELRVLNHADDVRFYINGVGPIPGTYIGSISASLDRWRLISPIAGGYYQVTAQVQVDGEWYSIDDSSDLYSIDTPWFDYLNPTAGKFFRPADRFTRINIDDEFNQFQSVTFRIYNTGSATGVNDHIAQYTLNRADCDLTNAGVRITCDLVRDFNVAVSPLTEGNYFVRIQSSTLANNGVRYNHVNSSSEIFGIDTNRPTVDIFQVKVFSGDYSYPQVTPVITGNNLNASAMASDLDGVVNSGIDYVRFTITDPRIGDGVCDGNGTTYFSEDSTVIDGDGYYRVSFDLSSLINGNDYCLNVRARDNSASNSLPVQTLKITLDNEAPTVGPVQAVTTFSGEFVMGDSTGFQIRMRAIDTSGISLCEYSLNNGIDWSSAGTYVDISGTNPICRVDNINATNGELLNIMMRATDNAGNTATGAMIERTADALPPTVNLINVNPDFGGSYTSASPQFLINISDDVSPIDHCQYRFRKVGDSWSPWTDGTIIGSGLDVDCSVSFSNLEDSETYEFRFRGGDSIRRASHRTLITSIFRTIDATLPDSSITSPLDNSYWNTPIEISGQSTDNVGVNFVNIYSSPAGMNDWTLITTMDNLSNGTPFDWSYNWTPSAEGTYDLMARATDTVGNVESTAYAYAVTYDVTPPVSIITNPLANDTVNGTIDVRASITDENPMRYYAVVRNSSNTVVSGPGTVYESNSIVDTVIFSLDTTTLPDGDYSIFIAARDQAGNRTAVSEDTVNFTIDNTPPVSTLNAFLPNPTNNNTPTFIGSVEDLLSNVNNVEYRYSSNGGIDWSVWISVTPDDLFDSLAEGYSFTTPALADGDYIFQVRGIDVVGNVETIVNDESQQTLTIDTEAPIVTINTLDTRDRTPQLTGTVSDNNDVSDVVVEVTVNGSKYTAVNNGDGTWTVPDNTISPNLPDGIYNILVEGTDLAGNTGTDVTNDDLRVDRTRPNHTYNGPESDDYVSGSFIISGDAIDPIVNGFDSGVRDVRVRFHNQSNDVVARSCFANYDDITDSYSLSINDGGCDVADGQYYIRLRTRDNLGNSRNEVVATYVTIDNVSPTVNMLSDDTYYEGADFPVVEFMGSDNVRIDQLCVEVVASPLGSISSNCFDTGEVVNPDFTWTAGNLIDNGYSNTFIDTSLFPEGNYNLNYFVMDKAGNTSTTHSVTYTIVNAAPVVTFGSNQTISEGESASFTGSFTDPSSNDNGDGILDDASWTATVDFGDGTPVVNLGSFANPSLITIPNHVYTNDGTYSAILTVCEADPADVTSSEGQCSSDYVTIEVLNILPTVSINANPSTSILTGQSVSLTADISANVLPGNQIDTFTWSGACSGTNATTTFSSATIGTFVCTVTVTDMDGDTATENITIVVTNTLPNVVLIVSPSTTVTQGTSVSIQGNITAGDANFTYVFSSACSGNGTSTGGLTNVTTVPSSIGSYYCRIDVTDANGDSSSAGVVVNVVEAGTPGALGIGAGSFDDNSETIEEENSEEEDIASEGSILGTQTCTEKETLSGRIYIDTNENGEFNDEDELFEDVEVTVFGIDADGNRELVRNISTNEFGLWTLEVCPGEYEIVLNENSIPEDTEVENSILSLTIEGNEDRTQDTFSADFVLVSIKSSGGINPFFIIAGVGFIAILLLTLLRNSKQRPMVEIQ